MSNLMILVVTGSAAMVTFGLWLAIYLADAPEQRTVKHIDPMWGSQRTRANTYR